MKEVVLSAGKVALVDDADFELISRFKWTATKCSRQGKEKWYAVRKEPVAKGVRKTVYMHRFLMSAPPHQVVDHLDGSGLNNQRHNLELKSQCQNTVHCRFKPRTELFEPCL